MTQDEARARVAKGAAHLDQVRPGWFNRIDIGTLALHDPCGCIVGQLCRYVVDTKAGFAGAVLILGLSSHDDAVAHGVDVQWGEMFAPLQEAWIEAIADRLLPTSDGVQSHVSTGVRDTGAVPQFRG